MSNFILYYLLATKKRELALSYFSHFFGRFAVTDEDMESTPICDNTAQAHDPEGLG